MADVTMADGRAVDPPEGSFPTDFASDFASEPADGNCEPGELGPEAEPVPVVLASPDHPELAFVQAKTYAKGRPDGHPLWIVVHDMEASETSTRAENTAQYFATLPDGRSVSSHYCADSDSVVQCVRLADTAYTVGNRPGNYRGINWEFSGFASQTREQWLDPFGVAMFDQAAPIIRSDAQRYGIPLVHRTVAELRSYIPGVASHHDLGLAFGGTTHTDPGPNFPWDYFMDLINQADDGEVEDMARLTFFLADGTYWRSNGTTIRQIKNGGDFKQVADRGDCFPDVDANGFPTPDIILDPQRGGWTWEQIKLAYGEDEAVLSATGSRIEVAGTVTLTGATHGRLAVEASAPVQRAVEASAPVQRTVDE